MSAADDPAPKRPRTEAAVGEADAAAAEAPVTPAERAGLANGDEPAVLDNGDQGGAADADAGPVGDEAAAALEEDDARREEALAGLLAVQGELEQVNDEASVKVLEVEMQYNQRRRPVYQKRNSLIRNIEDFWQNVFEQHTFLNGCVRGRDAEALAFLEEVDVCDLPDIKSGFTVTFSFAEGNPLFANRVLHKKYSFSEDGRLTVDATPVDWLVEAEEGANGPWMHGSSFFTWFDQERRAVPTMDDVDDIAAALKDDIWPNPLKYYTGDMQEAGMPGNPIDLDEVDEFMEDEYTQEDYDAQDEVEPEEDEDDEYEAAAEAAGLGEAPYDGRGPHDPADPYEEDGEYADEEEEEAAAALAAEEGADFEGEAEGDGAGEEDEEAARADAAAEGGEGAAAGGGPAPDPGGKDEEEEYDDEGADHDREDDEE